MIQSMTGYGKAEGSIGTKQFIVEIKSLNSKVLDLNLRIPGIYREKELEMRSLLADTIVRGKSDLSIHYESAVAEKKVTINRPLLESYYRDMKEIAESLEIPSQDYMAMLMRIPDVLKPEREELNAEEWNELKALINEALKNFVAYRKEEGRKLQSEFVGAIENIMKQFALLDLPLQARIDKIRARISGNLAEFVESENLDVNRLEQEMVYYIEKLDVSEEKQRLKSNCDYFLEVLKEEQAQGRKLGFISQEIGREINTLGSKANDAEVQKMVVKMKDELEKIKEQILNVL